VDPGIQQSCVIHSVRVMADQEKRETVIVIHVGVEFGETEDSIQNVLCCFQTFHDLNVRAGLIRVGV